MLERFKAKGLLKSGGKQRTDATHVLAAIRLLNRLECVGETLRAALNDLATVVPDWLRVQVTPEWFDRYATRFEAYRLPKDEAERQSLAEVIGQDGFYLLQAIYEPHPQTPNWLREMPSVGVLRQTWLFQYWVDDGQLRFRKAGELPPAGMRMDSPYDPQAHYGNKRSVTWTGYKVHLTETCDEKQIHLITHVDTTLAAISDVARTEPIQKALEEKQLLPDEHLVDAGYVDAELIVSSKKQHGIKLIGPVRPNVSWQSRANEGFDISNFKIDWDEEHAVCPNNKVSKCWTPQHDKWGNKVIKILFSRTDCGECKLRSHCTHSQAEPRCLTVRQKADHEALQSVRQLQKTAEWKTRYNARAGIEGTLAQGVSAFGLRHCRYKGLAKTHFQHLATAGAINITRLSAWLENRPHAPTRTSRFAKLALAG